MHVHKLCTYYVHVFVHVHVPSMQSLAHTQALVNPAIQCYVYMYVQYMQCMLVLVAGYLTVNACESDHTQAVV